MVFLGRFDFITPLAHTCIMASIIQRTSRTPKAANRQRARLDRVLDPAMMRALAEPTRARLLSCLLKCARACSVTEVAECCSIDFSMVARHLSTLASAGMLHAEKQGRTVWYTADAEALATRFRAIAEAIEELKPADACADGTCCVKACGHCGEIS